MRAVFLEGRPGVLMSSPSEQLFGPRVVLGLAHPHPGFPEAEFLAGRRAQDKPLGGQLPPLAHRIPVELATTVGGYIPRT